jgi:hypothetical protein
MHDPKFEKEVQQKMEALEFSPSDSVWIRLEEDLKKEKRRSAPLFWLFFLVGGMLLGAGGTWLFFNHAHHSVISASVISPATGTSTMGNSAAAGSSIPSTKGSPTPSTPGSSTPGSSIPGTKIFRQYADNDRQATKQPDMSLRAAGDPYATRPKFSETETLDAGSENNVRSVIRIQPLAIRLGFATNIASGYTKIATGSGKNLTHAWNSSANSSSAKKAMLSKTPKWEAGFAGGSGISSLVSGVGGQTASPAANPAALNSFSAYPFARSAPAPATGFTPRFQPDLSFWAGVFVQKPILKKLSLSIGLNLHYYSTRVSTGQQIVNNVPGSAATLFNSSVVVASQTLPSYSPGDTHNFLNRYYFLELPISLQWQINRGRQIPLFLEGGVSAARLMGANAIYYDQAYGMYYKDGTPSNSFRLFTSAALMAGLHWRGASIQLGPQFQYGLSSLLNGSAGAGQHMLYGGIKITVIPGRR